MCLCWVFIGYLLPFVLTGSLGSLRSYSTSLNQQGAICVVYVTHFDDAYERKNYFSPSIVVDGELEQANTGRGLLICEFMNTSRGNFLGT